MTTTLPAHVDVLVVGSGFAGMGVTARVLREDPSADVLVIERADDVGGTWRDNTYPGVACDVPTSLYSFSFAPHSDWSHTFARGPEIHRYLRGVADDFGIRDRLVTGCALLGAQWDEERCVWDVTTEKGDLTCRVLVAATGTLSTPKLPAVPGLDTFAGHTFHSATWDHDYDLRGKRVAVVGTGASAIQFVPEIAPVTSQLHVFQRTPAWVIPRMDRTRGPIERWFYRRAPWTLEAQRGAIYAYREMYVEMMAKRPKLLSIAHTIATGFLRLKVRDGGLRKRLTPGYTIGCKRMLLSNDWYDTLQRPDVELVDSGLASITPTGVVDAAGREREVDAIVFGTGFTPTEPPVAHLLRGSDGRTLAERWGGSPRAYRGTTMAGFPNLFLMYGPNTNLGHSSIVYMLESQSAYVESALREMTRRSVDAVDVSPSAVDEWNASLDADLAGTVWNTGGCSSWYLDASGRNSAMWPTFTWKFRKATAAFDIENYRTMRARGGPDVGRTVGSTPSEKAAI
ncbi:NAD(P)/FAD-dependent oxidoreductase [Rhodococcus sp. NBC_00294]|nr:MULTISPECIES: NAD(P)/FAD-dependent oxidoreductase [unclassified Rhodococcus (in: high G+C Gram-positive bacteria)]MDQ1182302.1 cation diffusion facilitator CzcD-associated flavoprotein CzcO [Rhodococcus sp. SORGH_AS_0301]MDQ1203623.1 cation diffusion facilitator CzcD-associated flavoprotein CzcO [Rhodococcus sp. SORGH_AS_0303]